MAFPKKSARTPLVVKIYFIIQLFLSESFRHDTDDLMKLAITLTLCHIHSIALASTESYLLS